MVLVLFPWKFCAEVRFGGGGGIADCLSCLQGSAELDFGSEQGGESSTLMLFKNPITSSA